MKRNKFSLSNYKLFSCDMGELVPVGLTEVLPGDTVQQATSALIRLSPLLSPVMHPVHVRIHHWFVPHRMVWANGIDDSWEAFITGGHDGMDASTFPTITFPNGGPEIGTLADYLGVPTDIVQASGTAVNALPFRGYALIWNEWYRDQDLETALTIDLTGGADTTTNTTLQNVSWEKDYFTSSRPWEQKGPEVTLPLGTTAPVKTSASAGFTGAQEPMQMLTQTGATPGANLQMSTGATAGKMAYTSTGAGTQSAQLYPSNLYADLSTATAASVNTIREAFALQRYEEARARYGSRYTEYLRYLGVRSSDARLQRPEYLGGGKQTIQFSEVLQTAEGAGSVGSLYGHGIAAMRSNRYRRFFEEHGYVFTLMSVKPRTIYQQGLARTWNRRLKEDFWQRELQHIGQQPVLNKELYASHATPDGTFGYQDRYDEYRRTESTIAGEFRENSSYEQWHFARYFGSTPALNATFVKAVPTKQPFADTTSDCLLVMANHSIQARRMVSKTGSSFTY